jgi:cation diffusion facilitator CzcD-associated flavoprotein CzcO
VIDVGFLDVLTSGRVAVRPALTSLTERGARYTDGTQDPIDVVIAATGFTTGLERLLAGVPGVVGANGEPLSRSGEPTAASGLYLLGFDETVRGHLFEARRESLRLARTIARALTQERGETSSA